MLHPLAGGVGLVSRSVEAVFVGPVLVGIGKDVAGCGLQFLEVLE